MAATSPASVRINSKSATMPKPRSNKEKIEGWLFHKDLVEGSDETWRKRWVILDISTLSIWKKPTPTSDYLCESIPTHEITEMSYGASVEDRKEFVFSFCTNEGMFEFYASSLFERDDWVTCLRTLIPLAKAKRDQDIMLQTAKSQALLEVQERLAAESLSTIELLNSRVRYLPDFRSHAEELHKLLLELYSVVEQIGSFKVNACRPAAYWIVFFVDMANSTVSKCTVEKSASQIHGLTKDIVTGVSVLINSTAQISRNSLARVHVQQNLKTVHVLIVKLIQVLEVAILQDELQQSHTKYQNSSRTFMQTKIVGGGRWSINHTPTPLRSSPSPSPPTTSLSSYGSMSTIDSLSSGTSSSPLRSSPSPPPPPPVLPKQAKIRLVHTNSSPAINKGIPIPPIPNRPPPLSLLSTPSSSPSPSPSPLSSSSSHTPSPSPSPNNSARPLPKPPTNRSSARRTHLFAFEPTSISSPSSPPSKSPLAVMKSAQDLNETMKRVLDTARKASGTDARKIAVPLVSLDREGIERLSQDLTKTDAKLSELLELMRDVLKLGSPRDDIAVGKGKPSPLVARVVEVMSTSTEMLELLKSEREIDEKVVQNTIQRVERALNQLKECATAFASESTDSKTAPASEEELLTRARNGTFGVLKSKNLAKGGHRRTGSLGSPRNAATKGDRSLATDFISSLSTASSPTVSEEELTKYLHLSIANEELERIKIEEKQKVENLRETIAAEMQEKKAAKARAIPTIQVDQGDVVIKRKATKVLPGKRPEAPLPKALEVKRELETTVENVRRVSQRLSKTISRKSMMGPNMFSDDDLPPQLLQQASTLTDATATFIEFSIMAQQEIEDMVSKNMKDTKFTKEVVQCSQNVAAHIQQLAIVASQNHLDKKTRLDAMMTSAKCLKTAVSTLLASVNINADNASGNKKQLLHSVNVMCAATDALIEMVRKT